MEDFEDPGPWREELPILFAEVLAMPSSVAEKRADEPKLNIARAWEPQLTKVAVFTEYNSGGKRYSFTDPVGHMCECQICQGVVKEAQSVRCCKKTFCKDCLDKALKKSSTCPLCRSENPMKYENDAIDDGVNNLKVLCLHHGKGCQWSGHLLHKPQGGAV